MKVQLDKTYPMPVPADVAWDLLQDIQAVAGCMPGATITELMPGMADRGPREVGLLAHVPPL